MIDFQEWAIVDPNEDETHGEGPLRPPSPRRQKDIYDAYLERQWKEVTEQAQELRELLEVKYGFKRSEISGTVTTEALSPVATEDSLLRSEVISDTPTTNDIRRMPNIFEEAVRIVEAVGEREILRSMPAKTQQAQLGRLEGIRAAKFLVLNRLKATSDEQNEGSG